MPEPLPFGLVRHQQYPARKRRDKFAPELCTKKALQYQEPNFGAEFYAPKSALAILAWARGCSLIEQVLVNFLDLKGDDPSIHGQASITLAGVFNIDLFFSIEISSDAVSVRMTTFTSPLFCVVFTMRRLPTWTLAVGTPSSDLIILDAASA